MKESKMILYSLFLAIFLFLAFLFLMPSPKIPNIPTPWEATNINNQVNIFGLDLEKSTLKNAMQIFGSEAKVSLFKEKNKNNAVEVYFSSTKIGGLSVKIILTLITDEKDLQLLNANIKAHEVMPSGNEKVIFNDFANNKLLNNKIKNLSFIPRVSLSKADIIARFGEPKIKQIDAWIYPNYGLKIVRDDKLNIFEYKNQ